MAVPYYQDDWTTLYLGDWNDVVDDLDLGDVVVVTDPPYGTTEVERRNQPGHETRFAAIAGDHDDQAAADLFRWLPATTPAAIFGANNWPHLLPHKGRWVCWDKRLTREADRMLGSAFELAWLNVDHGYDRMIRCLHGGVVNANGHGLARVHPTEKPVPMLRELIGIVGGDGPVFDPFAGSGTTLRAAKDLGRRAIGVEIVEQYADAAARRLGQEVLDLWGA